MNHNATDDDTRAELTRRVEQLRVENNGCESVATILFSEQFDLMPDGSLQEAVAVGGQAFGGPRCSCEPLRTAMLSLGILGSRAHTLLPSEPMLALNVLEDRFRDTHCAECHAAGRVGGLPAVPLDTHCVEALVNGVMWVRELASERDWL